MTGMNPEDALELAKKIRMDCTQIQARLTDLIEYLAADDRRPAPAYRCDHCGIEFPSRMKLLDHAVLVHDDRSASDEREAEWERLAELAGQAEPPLQRSSEEPPDGPRELPADVAGYLERLRGEGEPALAQDAEPQLA